MASEERRAADKRIREENLFKTLGAEEVQAETDAFQCGRCKQVRFSWLAVSPHRLSLSSVNAGTAKHKLAVPMSL